MGIRHIDWDTCNACGICVEDCPMDVLRTDEESGKPFIQYLRDCQSCFLCQKECPVEAIRCYPTFERRIPQAW